MSRYTDRFVVANKDIKLSPTASIEKGDIGVIKSESQEGIAVFFIRIWQKAVLNRDDFKIVNVKKTGDSFPKKICNVCHKLLSTEEFAKNQNAKNNRSVRRPSCQKCRRQLEGVGIRKTEKDTWRWFQNHLFYCTRRILAAPSSVLVGVL